MKRNKRLRTNETIFDLWKGKNELITKHLKLEFRTKATPQKMVKSVKTCNNRQEQYLNGGRTEKRGIDEVGNRRKTERRGKRQTRKIY